MGTLTRPVAAAFLAVVATALLASAAFADPSPSPPAASPTPTASPAPAGPPGPAATAASPTPAASQNCGVTNFRTCLDAPTIDVNQAIWSSMTKLVADGAQNVILGLGCELGVPGSPGTSTGQAAAAAGCAGQQAGGQQGPGLLSPDLTSTYFSQYYQRAAVVAALVAMAIGMAAAAFFAVTRNGVRLAYAAFGYPSLVAIGIVVSPGLLATVMQLTDALGSYVAGPAQMGNALQNLSSIYLMPTPTGAAPGAGAPPVFVIMVAAMGALVFSLLAMVELLARSIAIYLVVLFWPVALASSAWGAGFGFAKRFLKVILALILAKPVMVIVISLGMGLISTKSLDLVAMVEGFMLLLVALLAPLAPFALIGGAEAAVTGQLELRQRLEQFAAGTPEPARAAATTAPAGESTTPTPALAPTPVPGGGANGRGRAATILRKSTDGSVGGAGRT